MDLALWKQIKKERKLTNQDLSELSGVPKRTIENIFSGHTPFPRADTVMAIKQALGLSSVPTDNLSAEERELIDLISQLTEDEVEELSKFIDFLIAKRK